MDYDGGFILQKDVNWSLLTEGLAIPTSICSRFADWDASIMTHKANKPVRILIDGEFYEATLKNQNFDQQRYPGHNIDYFTRSQNNDSTNIIIISPRSSFARLLPSGRKNYHRIIHENNLRFKRKSSNLSSRMARC